MKSLNLGRENCIGSANRGLNARLVKAQPV
jgi:hypothetical protein